MKRYHLSKLRSLLAELERNNTKIPAKLETLLQSSMKACVATLGHLPRIGVRVKLPFKAPHCGVCRKPFQPMAKPWTSNFGITYPLRCTNPKCSEQGKRKNYMPTKRKLVGKLSELQRTNCPVPRDKCPECKKEGFDTLRNVFQVHHPSNSTHNREVAWIRRCPRKGCPQRPQHFKADATLLPHRGKGAPLIDDTDRPTCQRPGCAGFGKLMTRRKRIELVGFGATKKYECTKGENQHVCYVVISSGDQIEPGTADKAKQKAWKLDLLPLDMRQCPRQGCTIPLRLGPRGGTVRQKAKSLYGAKGKRLGRRRRFGEEEYRYLLCRGSNKKQGHGTVGRVVGSVKEGSLRFVEISPKIGGRPRGMTEERIKEAIKLEKLIQKHGSGRGAFGKAVKEMWPGQEPHSAYERGRQTRKLYRRDMKERGTETLP